MNVVISEKARTQFDKMSLKTQRSARSAIEFLKAENLESLHARCISKPRGLHSGRVDNKTQIIFMNKSKDEVEVIRFE